MNVENYINETFLEYEKARDYIISKGFDYWNGETPVTMGEGYEHIFIYEYKHKTEPVICRLADLRWEQRKVKDKDRIPKLIGFIQVSIKEITTPTHA